MAHIIYYTKLGCITSTKQVELLRQSGHEVDVRDLLAQPWQPGELLAYFGDLPVKLWFNPHSPRVKSSEIEPSAYDRTAALELLLADHLLIRRPLMASNGTLRCGFDPASVHAWVGLSALDDAMARGAEFQSCSHPSLSEEQPTCP